MYATEYLAPGATLGKLAIQYKSSSDSQWSVANQVALDPKSVSDENTIRYLVESSPNLLATQTFSLDAERLTWTITLANRSSETLEIGDLALPLPMAEATPDASGQIYTKKLIRHSLIAGHGSWIYWQRANAVGPFLVMVPQSSTKFEFAGRFVSTENADARETQSSRRGRARDFTPFIHAAVSSKPAIEQGKAAGRTQPWRLPLSSLELAPQGTSGDTVTYQLVFAWAADFDGVRDTLYEHGSVDVNIVPGMTLPTDLNALIALRTKHKITDIVAEFPETTKLEFVADRGRDIKFYRVRFNRLGENMLTVRYGDNQWATLEFFVTEPLETLIAKRAAFLVNRHQHRDPSKWWYGVYSDWDQIQKVLRGPGNRDGLAPWLVEASDDAGNARPAYVASKNLYFPINSRSIRLSSISSITYSQVTIGRLASAGCR